MIPIVYAENMYDEHPSSSRPFESEAIETIAPVGKRRE